MKKYSCAALTVTGKRANNQDNFVIGTEHAPLDHAAFSSSYEMKEGKPLFAAVADGMGGEASGEKASYTVCSQLSSIQKKLKKSFEKNKSAVIKSIERANEEVCRLMRGNNHDRMGSTLAAALLQGDRLYYTNLGDSRIYLLRGGVLTQLTRDHSEGQSMVEAGVITADQLRSHPSRNRLSRYIGIFPEEMTFEIPEYSRIDLLDGDKLLICSDGVYGAIEPDQLTALLSGPTSTQDRAKKTVDSALMNGSRDNVTALLIDVNEDEEKPGILPYILGAAAGLITVGAILMIISFFIRK